MFYLRNILRLVVLWQLVTGICEAQNTGEIVVYTKSDDHPTVVFNYWANQTDISALRF